MRHHPRASEIKLSFGFPLRDTAALDALIAQQARTHRYLSRPSSTTGSRLRSAGRRAPGLARRERLPVTHVGADRMALTAVATTATVEKALHARSTTTSGQRRPSAACTSSRTASTRTRRRRRCRRASASRASRACPTSIASSPRRSSTRRPRPTPGGADCGDEDNAVINPLCVDVRAGGYFPSDLQGLYDITGHGYRRRPARRSASPCGRPPSGSRR